MLGARDTRQVAWKRRYAQQHYLGYVTVSESGIRLAGHEQASGIDAALTIPHGAIRKVRVGRDTGEDVVGERSVVLELTDNEPIYVRPVCAGKIDLEGFARRLVPS
jgi:hypothetical protein